MDSRFNEGFYKETIEEMERRFLVLRDYAAPLFLRERTKMTKNSVMVHPQRVGDVVNLQFSETFINDPPVVSEMFLWLDPNQLSAGASQVWEDSAGALVAALGEIPGQIGNDAPDLNALMPLSQTHANRNFDVPDGQVVFRNKRGNHVLRRNNQDFRVQSQASDLYFPVEHTVLMVVKYESSPALVRKNGFRISRNTRYFPENTVDGGGEDTFGNLTYGYLPFSEQWQIVAIRRTVDEFQVERLFEDGSQDSLTVLVPFSGTQELREFGAVDFVFAEASGLYGDLIVFSRSLAEAELADMKGWLYDRWFSPGISPVPIATYHVVLSSGSILAKDIQGFAVRDSGEFEFLVLVAGVAVARGKVA